jgi:hypothetical protein
VHAVAAVCSGTVSITTGAGVNSHCMNEAALYFLGFALTILGLVVLAIALFTMAKKERFVQRMNRRRAITTLQRREKERLRDAA